MAAGALALIDMPASRRVSDERTLVEERGGALLPRAKEAHDGRDVSRGEGAAALDSPGRHRRADAPVRDRGREELGGDGGEEVLLCEGWRLIGFVPLALCAMAHGAHPRIDLATVGLRDRCGRGLALERAAHDGREEHDEGCEERS